MSSFVLKIIAYIFMVIDHCTVVFEWNNDFRCIGRIAFPIFAYLISEGCKHTKNFKIYILRLLICAFISEWIYDIMFNREVNLFFDLNILFTLALSVFGIYIFENFKKYYNMQAMGYCIILLFMYIAEIFRFDYGFLGVGLIFMFYFLNEKKQQIFALLIFTVLKYGTVILGIISREFNVFALKKFVGYAIPHNIYSAIFTFVPAMFIYYYNGKKGLFVKYLFYILYPAHIFIIYIIRILIEK